ncbi:MarR family winged helix-turn-helix transcriptional regulator [Frankia sp. R82]|uniref:MarR family winged helix-turn-helix transcriptional regulator n=1 Tax=Frankia sp. R82 TaxID=2950553 RepID=UPI002043BB7B|nr:MarR family winged helix-turn-helix transcriptional regulator [Frankia sp. R82]MCM3885501.1 MarR family winged helix-turn-helix transcriptional regulator [Frankia sp. R82]
MGEQSFTRESAPTGPPAALTNRLGYLLKHAQLRLADLGASALAPFGINGRECAVLIVIDDVPPLSQLELARRMGVDRTTMVALIDELEAKALVARRPDPHDRRRNVVGLTESGRTTLRAARSAHDQAEERFLEGLPEEDAVHLKRILRAVMGPVSDDGRQERPQKR